MQAAGPQPCTFPSSGSGWGPGVRICKAFWRGGPRGQQVWETLATLMFMTFVVGATMYAGVGGAWLWWPRLCGEGPQGGGGGTSDWRWTRRGQGSTSLAESHWQQQGAATLQPHR